MTFIWFFKKIFILFTPPFFPDFLEKPGEKLNRNFDLLVFIPFWYKQKIFQLNDTEWHRMTQNDTEWHRMTQNDTEWHWMTLNSTEWHRMTQNDI